MNRLHVVTAARRTMTAGVLVVAGLVTTATSGAADAGCPTAAPVSDAVAGMAVTGYTVSSGTTPDQFTGSVLGVLKDGIAPGLDLIIADLDSPALESVGGIWAGMSGSPVYTDDGRLLGAVSYGLSAGPSRIAGITPAEDMYAVLDEASAAAAAPTSITLSSGLRSAAVSSGGATTSQADSGMRRLPVPLAVSGLLPQRRSNPTLMAHLATPGMVPYAAGAAGTAPVTDASADPATDIVPGSNFAAGLSYGDLSAIAVGTATAVCGTNVVAFGHPFLFNGATAESMHGGDTIVVQDDSTFGPYKLTNPTGPIGTITEDRLAGIAGPIGPVPASIPVTSSVSSEGRHRDGETDAVFPDLLPDIAALHLLSNTDRIFDQIGPGDALMHTVITGKRSDGSPWTFARTDRVADPFDESFAMAFPLYDDVATLQQNQLDRVSIDSVDVSTDVEPGYTDYHISSVQVRNRHGVWATVNRNHPARLVAGSRAQVHVNLTGYQGTGTRTVPFTFTVPAGTVGAFGSLLVNGGNGGGMQEFGDMSGASTGSKTFDGLLASLEHAPRQDDVVSDLFLGTPPGPKPGPTMPLLSTEHRSRVDRVVNGARFIPAVVVAPAAPKPGYVKRGTWSLRNSLTSGAPSSVFAFGGAGVPLMGDWDGDGVTSPAVFANGVWTIQPSALSPDTVTVDFGAAGDKPVVGDWNGDGVDDLGIVSGDQFLMRSDLSPAATTSAVTLPAGLTGAPVAGDWNGDGIDTLAMVQGSTWTTLRHNATGSSTHTITLTGSGIPVSGDWNRDGRTGIGYYAAGTWLLRQSATSGKPTQVFVFGVRGSRPVVAR